jgi:UDP-GlcNAc3NAcA epimerase
LLKVVSVVGARPQFIKAAAVSREIARHSDLQEIIVHTGQHFDDNMSDIFFAEMQIPRPQYHLGVHSMNHGAMTGRMLEKVEEILLREKPDLVMVYGDTNSTLAGALAAKKLHLKVAHVEAGLRSFNMKMPEEVNRILTDRISDLLFCPTDHAVANLRREGFEAMPCAVVKTGDVMRDAALHYAAVSAETSSVVARLGLAGETFALCTVHRAENTDDPARLRAIIAALNDVSERMRVVLPLHPRTAALLKRAEVAPRFTPIEPVGYFDMLELLKRARIVLTDSGGLQKEAFFFAKPCVTLRDETEWVELVEGGYNRIAGADRNAIVASVSAMLETAADFDRDLYGRSSASEAIVAAMKRSF